MLDFLWNSLILDPMTNGLMLLYSLLGNNFVLAIVVFTIVMRLITLPLSLKQQRSSMRMQEMQPQVQAIQKKYRDNPQRMQEEFKKIGYNPTETLTGCLPLLIQMPILFGLYRAIFVLLGSTPQALFELTDRVYPFVDKLVGVSTELPIANKFLWLNLGLPDPYYVLPVLIFASMFISQRLLMPPQQKKQDGKAEQSDNPMAGMSQSMQYTMPLMMTFFSLSFPSGLSIYWILSNVVSVGQGYITRRSMAQEKEAMEARRNVPKTTGIPAEAKAASGGPDPAAGPSQSSRQRRSSKRKRRSAKR